jgi:hypothetical protein
VQGVARIYLNISKIYSYSVAKIWIWYTTNTIRTRSTEYDMDMNMIYHLPYRICIWPAPQLVTYWHMCATFSVWLWSSFLLFFAKRKTWIWFLIPEELQTAL